MADKDRAQCYSMGRDLRVIGSQLFPQPLLPRTQRAISSSRVTAPRINDESAEKLFQRPLPDGAGRLGQPKPQFPFRHSGDAYRILCGQLCDQIFPAAAERPRRVKLTMLVSSR